jgi:hypothetical protein
LKLIFNEIGKKNNISIEIELIAPPVDETSKERARGGWGNVKSWCVKFGTTLPPATTPNDLDLLKEAGFIPELIDRCQNRPCWPTLLTMAEADGVLIHMDSDIAEAITGLDEDFLTSGLSRKDFCMNAIQTWLGTAEQDDLHFIIATFCLETWFVATYDGQTSPNIFPNPVENYEDIQDPSSLLLAMGYKSYIDTTTGKITIDKKALTEEYANQIVDNLDISKSRCLELKRTISYVESFV